jgi:hypothetical protein
MGTQSLSDRKSTTPTIVSRNAMNPFGAKDLTARAATLSPVAASAREGVITKAPYYQSEFREDLAEYVCTAPLATEVIDAAIAAGHFVAPASGLKAAGLSFRAAPRRRRPEHPNAAAQNQSLEHAMNLNPAFLRKSRIKSLSKWPYRDTHTVMCNGEPS